MGKPYIEWNLRTLSKGEKYIRWDRLANPLDSSRGWHGQKLIHLTE